MPSSNNLKLVIKVTADTRETIKSFAGLKKSVAQTEKEFKQAQQKVSDLARALKVGEGNTAGLSREFEAAKRSAASIKRTLEQQTIALDISRKSLQQSGISTKALSQHWRQLKKDVEQANAALRQTQAVDNAFKRLDVRPFRDIEREINNIDKAYAQLKTSGVASQAELNRANLTARRQIRALKSEMNGFGQSLKDVHAQVIGMVVALAGITSATKEVIRVGTEFESYNNSLKAVLGSQQAAQKAMAFLRDESERLGTSLEVNIPAFTKLAASAKGTALAGKPVRDIFTAISEAAVVLGLSSEQVDGSLTALSQIMSKSTVSAEELRGQLGERLFGAFNLAAESIGVTTAELDKMLKTGSLSADQFLPKFAAQIRKTFGADVKNAVQSSQAAFNRLNNAIYELKISVANSGVVDAFAALANVLTGLLGVFQDLSPLTKSYIAVIASAGMATLAWRLGIRQIATALYDAAIPALAGATAGARAFGLALKATGLVGLGLLIFETGRALYEYAVGADKSTQSTHKLTAAQQKLKVAESELKTQLGRLNAQRTSMEQQLTDATLEESKQRTRQQIQDNKRVVAELEANIEKAKQLQQQYSDDISQRQKKIANIQQSTEDKIRAIKRKGYSEDLARLDLQNQIAEKLQAAKQAAQTDPAETARLAKQAESLASELGNRRQLIDVLEKSKQLQIEAEQAAIQLAEKNRQAQIAQQQQLEQQLASQKDRLQELIAKKSELEQPVTLKIESNIDEINKKINELQQRLFDLNSNINIAGSHSERPPGFANGGVITGPGTSTSDSILARLSNGEFVVKAAAVKHYGSGLLNNINTMSLPKFANGGLVTQGSGTPINITLPGGQQFGPFLDNNGQAEQLQEALRREVLKRGRRR